MPDLVELDDRIAKCNKILDESPNSQIFAALAEAYRKKGELDKAFRVCQNGLKIHPNYGFGINLMIRAAVLYDWAQMEVEKSVNLDGNSHATDLLLAEIHIYKGEFAHATRILDKLRRVDPKNKHVMKLMEIAKKLPLESRKNIEPIVEESESQTAENETPPEAGAKEPIREISPKIMIDILANIPGVDGVMLVNHEGMVAESNWNCPEEPELFGALAREIERIINEQTGEANFGKYEDALIEAENLVLKFLPFGKNLLLIKANTQVNLGTLRLKLTSLLDTCNVNL